jgi:hypothetical protein
VLLPSVKRVIHVLVSHQRRLRLHSANAGRNCSAKGDAALPQRSFLRPVLQREDATQY